MDISLEDVDNCNSDAFEKWVKENKIKRWTLDTRYDAICFTMKKNNLNSVYLLKHKHLYNVGISKTIFVGEEFDNKMSNMIEIVLKERGINIDLRKFARHPTKREKEEMFQDVVRIEMTDAYHKNLCDARKLIELKKTIIEEFIKNPLEHHLDFIIDKGVSVVYGVVINKSEKLIYIGSTNDFTYRVSSHRAATPIYPIYDNNDDYICQFHNYIKENKLRIGVDVTIVPICRIPTGFEVFVEAEFFDVCKSLQEQNANIDLLNYHRPVDKKYNIDSKAIIYKWIDLSRAKPTEPLYVGSTMILQERLSDHKHFCFKMKFKNKLYEYMRSQDGENLAPNLKIRAMYVVPVGIRYEIEKKVIVEYDLINHGLNMANVAINLSEKKDRKKARAKERLQNMSDEQLKEFRIKANQSSRRCCEKKLAEMTHDELKARKEKLARRAKDYYRNCVKENLTDEQKEQRKIKHREMSAEKRANITDEQKAERRRKDREKYAEKLANMTDVEKEEFRAKVRAQKQKNKEKVNI